MGLSLGSPLDPLDTPFCVDRATFLSQNPLCVDRPERRQLIKKRKKVRQTTGTVSTSRGLTVHQQERYQANLRVREQLQADDELRAVARVIIKAKLVEQDARRAERRRARQAKT